MAGKRGHGEGSIFWLDSKQRWAAEVSLPDGSRKRHLAKTKREAQEWLNRARLQAQEGILPTGQRQTVTTFLTRWLADVAKPSVRERTYIRYEELLTQHAMRAIGKLHLDGLTPQHLQKLYADKRRKEPSKVADVQKDTSPSQGDPAPDTATRDESAPRKKAKGARKKPEGLAPNTIGQMHRILHRAFQDAVRWGLMVRNPCDLVKPPRAVREELHVLDEAQAARFLVAASEDPLEALWVMAVTTGMREGELLGLKWADLDLDGHSVQVCRTVYPAKGGGFAWGEPKSANSRRRIALMPQAVDALRRHKDRQARARAHAEQRWEENDLVFPNGIGRPMSVGNMIQRGFRPLLLKAELPRVRFHDLRHTAATLFLAADTHPKVVQEMLGHSSITVTMDTYSHRVPTMQPVAVEAMSQRLSVIYDATAKQIAQAMAAQQEAGEEQQETAGDAA